MNTRASATCSTNGQKVSKRSTGTRENYSHNPAISSLTFEKSICQGPDATRKWFNIALQALPEAIKVHYGLGSGIRI